MTEIQLEVSEEALTAPVNDPEKLSREILISAAVKLYEAKKLSSGKAAQLVAARTRTPSKTEGNSLTWKTPKS